jgi:hypothetical protein
MRGRVDRPGAGLGVNQVVATGERVPPAETCLSEFFDDRSVRIGHAR